MIGWSNLLTPKAPVERPKDDSKVIDALSKVLRADLFLAIKNGNEITEVGQGVFDVAAGSPWADPRARR